MKDIRTVKTYRITADEYRLSMSAARRHGTTLSVVIRNALRALRSDRGLSLSVMTKDVDDQR